MNNGKRFAYKNKLLKKLVTTRSCGIQIFLVLLFLLFFVFHNRDIFKKDKRTKKRETDEEIGNETETAVEPTSEMLLDDDGVGIECAYSFAVDRKVKAWRHVNIVIKLNRFTNCTRQRPFTMESGASVFRLHAYSTHEMVTATATYVGNDKSYRAQLLLTFPVKYTVMVMLVYLNGLAVHLLGDSKPLLRQISGSPFDLNVSKENSTNQSTRYCTRNESGSVVGRWVKCGGAVPGLERCGAWLSSDFDLDGIHGFRWVPYACQYHQYTNDELRSCFSKNQLSSIVLAGDSHMKFRTFHWVTRFYGNCHACTGSTPQTVFKDRVPRIEWIPDEHGTRLPHTFLNETFNVDKLLSPKRTGNMPMPFDAEALQAKLFVLNFGRFVLMETKDVMLINIKLHTYGKAAQVLQRMGKVVIWLTSSTGTWSRDHNSQDPFVPTFRIRHFNTIAERIMRHYKIPVVDTFDIADGRIPAVNGLTHFVKKLPGNDFGGVVENTITNCIMNLLCNE